MPSIAVLHQQQHQQQQQQDNHVTNLMNATLTMNVMSSDDEKSYDYTGVLDGFYSGDEHEAVEEEPLKDEETTNDTKKKDEDPKEEREERFVLTSHDSMGSGVFGSKVDLFAINSDSEDDDNNDDDEDLWKHQKDRKWKSSEAAAAAAETNDAENKNKDDENKEENKDETATEKDAEKTPNPQAAQTETDHTAKDKDNHSKRSRRKDHKAKRKNKEGKGENNTTSNKDEQDADQENTPTDTTKAALTEQTQTSPSSPSRRNHSVKKSKALPKIQTTESFESERSEKKQTTKEEPTDQDPSQSPSSPSSRKKKRRGSTKPQKDRSNSRPKIRSASAKSLRDKERSHSRTKQRSNSKSSKSRGNLSKSLKQSTTTTPTTAGSTSRGDTRLRHSDTHLLKRGNQTNQNTMIKMLKETGPPPPSRDGQPQQRSVSDGNVKRKGRRNRRASYAGPARSDSGLSQDGGSGESRRRSLSRSRLKEERSPSPQPAAMTRHLAATGNSEMTDGQGQIMRQEQGRHKSKSMSEIDLDDETDIVVERSNSLRSFSKHGGSEKSLRSSNRAPLSRTASGRSFISTASTDSSKRITRTFRRTPSGRSLNSNPGSSKRSRANSTNMSNSNNNNNNTDKRGNLQREDSEDRMEKELIKKELRAMLQTQLSKRFSDDENSGEAKIFDDAEPIVERQHLFQENKEESNLVSAPLENDNKLKKTDKKRKKKRRKKSKKKKALAGKQQFILVSEPNLSLPAGGIVEEVKADSDISSSSYTDSDYSSFSSDEDDDEEEDETNEESNNDAGALPAELRREETLDDVFMGSADQFEADRSDQFQEASGLLMEETRHSYSVPLREAVSRSHDNITPLGSPKRPASVKARSRSDGAADRRSIKEQQHADAAKRRQQSIRSKVQPEPEYSAPPAEQIKQEPTGAVIAKSLRYHKVVRFLGELARKMNKTNMISLATPTTQSNPGQQQQEARSFYLDQVEPNLTELREVCKDLKRQVMSVCESIERNHARGHDSLNDPLEEERVNLMASIDEVQNLEIELRILLDDINEHHGA